jgi:hypothetical protein
MSTGVMPAAWQAAMVAAADQPEQPQPAFHLAGRRRASPVGCRDRQDTEAVASEVVGAVSGLGQSGNVADDHFFGQHGFRRALADDPHASAG